MSALVVVMELTMNILVLSSGFSTSAIVPDVVPSKSFQYLV